MVYRAFAYVNAIIHAHPFYVQPFCAAEKPVQPALYYLDKYGEIDFIERVPNYSQEQADRIVVHLRRKTDLMKDAAASAATVLTEATAECEIQVVRDFLPQVQVKSF